MAGTATATTTLTTTITKTTTTTTTIATTLLQRPNEIHTEYNRTIWCTGTPNNCLIYIHPDSTQQLWYCSKDDIFPPS